MKESGPSVLVVDDSAFFRTMLVDLLAADGIDARAAVGGTEGWELVRTHRPGVVVSDWIMPDMDGLELCRLIRQSPDLQKTYIVLLTSKDKVEDAIRAMEQGADDFISKSADPREVVVRVKVGLRVAGLYSALAEAERRLAVAGMVVTLGHEIFNPLQIITGFAELLERESSFPPDAREKGAAILSAAKRIEELVKRVQAMPRISYARYAGSSHMVDLGGPSAESAAADRAEPAGDA